MSENKRVIRVKDLVIQADNVIIEPARRRDPILGGLRRTNDERVESINREVESNEREGKDRDRDHSPGFNI